MADEVERRLFDEIEQRRISVAAALKKGATLDALRLSLRNPPLTSISQEVKAANALVVSSAALAVRESELGTIVLALDAEEADTLLKYVYKALSMPSDKSGVWLRWHAALVEKAGTGAIVRVITEVSHTA